VIFKCLHFFQQFLPCYYGVLCVDWWGNLKKSIFLE
jgi:hypothetical protein